MTDFQQRLVEALRSAPNQIDTTSGLADRLKTSRLAVVSAMRSLERAGKVISFRGDGIYAAQRWALRTEETKCQG